MHQLNIFSEKNHFLSNVIIVWDPKNIGQNSELRIIYLTLYIYICVTIIQYSIKQYNLCFFYIPFGQGDSH